MTSDDDKNTVRSASTPVVSDTVESADSVDDSGVLDDLVEAARILINGRANCGWQTLITRAILTNQGARFDDDPTPDTTSTTDKTDTVDPADKAITPTKSVDRVVPIRSGSDIVLSSSDDAHEAGSDDDSDSVAHLSEPESVVLDRFTASQVEGQFGMRLRVQETYYPNLVAFVERFFARVFPYHQSAVVQITWTSQWWKYPALVFPLDALWRSYEAARKTPNGMVTFYLNASSLIDRVFNKDTGIIASLPVTEEHTKTGEPLPCEHPPHDWRARIVAQLEPPRPAGRSTGGSNASDYGERGKK